MELYEAIENTITMTKEVIEGMTQIKPEDCGLDNRAGYRLWIGEDAIAVARRNDSSLQYYGGFEYVQADDRVELGDYVFYLVESDRVREHIERWEELSE